MKCLSSSEIAFPGVVVIDAESLNFSKLSETIEGNCLLPSSVSILDDGDCLRIDAFAMVKYCGPFRLETEQYNYIIHPINIISHSEFMGLNENSQVVRVESAVRTGDREVLSKTNISLVLFVEKINTDSSFRIKSFCTIEKSDGKKLSREVSVMSYSLSRQLYSRVDGIFDTGLLENKKVLIVGLGTGGGHAAVQLAQCGVGKFILADFDRLEIHNVARHVCGLSDLGRLKTRAMRDKLRDINPHVKVELIEMDVLSDLEAFRAMIAKSDIVVMATDNEQSKFLTNRIALKTKTPVIYAGAYERAFGGEIIRVIPGETSCYNCIMGAVSERKGKADFPVGAIDYSNNSDIAQVRAEPGLNVDVSFVVLIQVKLAILTLLRNTDSSLEDIPYNVIYWGNRPGWLFKTHFESIFAEVNHGMCCPECDSNKFFYSEGRDPDALLKAGKKILENLDQTQRGL